MENIVNKWKVFFQDYRMVDINDDNDLLYQVGLTVGGKPISEQQFQELIESVVVNLELRKGDCLVDLCCGNQCWGSIYPRHISKMPRLTKRPQI